jgi:regulator of sigma E protease
MVLAALGISFLIFIHELGHFLAARMFGVRVDIFSVGFGPRLAGFRRGETDYRLSAIPLGGYVKMAGEYGDAPTDAPPRADELLAKPAWQRAIVFSAGVIANFLFAFVAFPIAFHGGIPFVAPVIGAVVPGGPAWDADLRPGDVILSIDGEHVHQFNDVSNGVALGDPQGVELRIRRGDAELNLRIHPKRNVEEGRWDIGIVPSYDSKLVVRSDGPAAQAGLRDGDRVVAVDGKPVETAPNGTAGLLTQAFRSGEPVTVSYERDGSVAEARVEPAPGPASGKAVLGIWPVSSRVEAVRSTPGHERLPLRADDVVLTVAGTRVAGPDSIRAALEQAPPGDVELLVRRGGRPEPLRLPADLRDTLVSGEVAFDFDRGGTSIVLEPGSTLAAAGLDDGDTILAVNGVDVTSYDELQRRIQDASPRFQITWRRGEDGPSNTASVETRELPNFDYGMNIGFLKVLHREDLPGAIRAGFDTSLNMLRMTWLTLAKLFTGDVGTKNLGGIVQISVLSYRIADESFTELLFFLGLLSINLGFINILPIPVLDGGQLLFLLFERIRGRRLSERFLNSMQMAGLVAIVALVVYVTFQDIRRLIE